MYNESICDNKNNRKKLLFRSFPEIQTGLVSGSGTWPAQSSLSPLDPFGYLGNHVNPGTRLGTFDPSSLCTNPNASSSNRLLDSSNLMFGAANPISRMDHSGMQNPQSSQPGLHDSIPGSVSRLEADYLRSNHSASGKIILLELHHFIFLCYFSNS
jgi:hypothetical protein